MATKVKEATADTSMNLEQILTSVRTMLQEQKLYPKQPTSWPKHPKNKVDEVKRQSLLDQMFIAFEYGKAKAVSAQVLSRFGISMTPLEVQNCANVITLTKAIYTGIRVQETAVKACDVIQTTKKTKEILAAIETVLRAAGLRKDAIKDTAKIYVGNNGKRISYTVVRGSKLCAALTKLALIFEKQTGKKLFSLVAKTSEMTFNLWVSPYCAPALDEVLKRVNVSRAALTKTLTETAKRFSKERAIDTRKLDSQIKSIVAQISTLQHELNELRKKRNSINVDILDRVSKEEASVQAWAAVQSVYAELNPKIGRMSVKTFMKKIESDEDEFYFDTIWKY